MMDFKGIFLQGLEAFGAHVIKGSLCILFLLAALPVSASTLVLQSGEEVTGLIVNKTSESVEMRVNGETVFYKTADVKEIKGRKAFQEPPTPQELEKKADGEFKKALAPAVAGRFDEAAQMLERMIENFPDYENAQGALTLCKGALSGTIKPDYARAVLEGGLMMVEKDYDRAIDLFKQALILNPDAIDLNYNIGYAYQALDNDEQAFPYFEIYNENYPDDPDVLAFLGTSYKTRGQIEKGNDYLLKAKKVFEEQGDFVKSLQMQMLIEKGS